jgi:hypothetical protein
MPKTRPSISTPKRPSIRPGFHYTDFSEKTIHANISNADPTPAKKFPGPQVRNLG